MKGGIVAVFAIIAIVSVVVQQGQAAVNCGQVDADLIQCVNYLTGKDAAPPVACCDGVKKVKAVAQTPEDKRQACKCVKDAANRYADLKDAAASSLPTKCGVDLDIPVSRTVNCDTIA